MKFSLVFVIFVAFYKVKTFSKNKALQKALENILEALAKQNNLVTAVDDGDFSETVFTPFVSFEVILHVVKIFEGESKKFKLTSSTLFSLDSAASLQFFNICTVLPQYFSMSRQLVIYLRNGTFEELAMFAISK